MAGLRNQAKADNKFILEQDVEGFRWLIQITDPAGNTLGDLEPFLYGFSNDIAQLIDPDTGQAVSGRFASVALHTQTLLDHAPFAGKLPINIPEENSDPWIVKFNDINGTPGTFKVQQGNPDGALGMITLLLEIYDDT